MYFTGKVCCARWRLLEAALARPEARMLPRAAPRPGPGACHPFSSLRCPRPSRHRACRGEGLKIGGSPEEGTQAFCGVLIPDNLRPLPGSKLHGVAPAIWSLLALLSSPPLLFTRGLIVGIEIERRQVIIIQGTRRTRRRVLPRAAVRLATATPTLTGTCACFPLLTITKAAARVLASHIIRINCPSQSCSTCRPRRRGCRSGLRTRVLICVVRRRSTLSRIACIRALGNVRLRRTVSLGSARFSLTCDMTQSCAHTLQVFLQTFHAWKAEAPHTPRQ